MKKETNQRCLFMQKQSIDQIRIDAFSGVSRRFFISFAYERQPGLRSPSWSDICNSLYFQAQQIEAQLSAQPCNNEVLSTTGDSEHAMDILYNCMCRKEAEIKSLEAKKADVIEDYRINHGYKPESGAYIPINQFIAPQRIDPDHFKYVVVDGKYYMFGYIHKRSYPISCLSGWLAPFISMGEGVDIDIYVEQKPTGEIQSQLTNSMKLSHSDYSAKSRFSADIYELENKIKSEHYIRERLSNGHTLCYFTVMVSVVADSAAAVQKKYKTVQNFLISSKLILSPLHSNHDLALKASLPLCAPINVTTRYGKRNIMSGDFGAFYPFTSYEVNDVGGIQIGRNHANNSPMFLNLFDRHLYTNGNMVIYGGSGSGKTFLLQCLAIRLRQQHVQVCIIAPYKGHEYGRACSAIGGSYITIAPGSPQNINIMEIRKYDSDNNNILDGGFALKSSILIAKIQTLHAFFSLLKPDMTHAERQLLDEALLITYRNKGITTGDKSLIDPKNPSQYKPMPTLGDLDAVLAKKGKPALGIRIAMERFVSGSCKNFNGQTNVNLDNPYVVIDISNMPDELMPVAIFIANDFVYDTIRADRLKRKAVVMDELSRLIGAQGSPEAAKFVLTQYKIVRAYNCVIIGATQDTNDFFAQDGGSFGKGILANAKLKVIMKQEPEEVPTVKNMLMLSDTEASRLSYYDVGVGLLVANRNHVEFEVKASTSEEYLFTTDPDRQAELVEIIRKEKS